MSSRNRHRPAAVFFCLLALACATPARGQALDSTPRVTRGTCPVAHCNLGAWQSAAAVPVYATPAGGKPDFSLKPRVPFEALSGQTYAIPGVHVLRGKLDVFDERNTASLRRGDTIRTLAYLGEGRFSIEAGGRLWVAVMNDRDAARFQTVRPRRETWWVEVKAPDGRRGWIDGGDPGIAGKSFDESMPPPTPAMLDGPTLAGLAGPVAGIVRQRASTTITTFPAPVEGARDGQGAAWWSGDRLSLLQLRYRTMLTADGTTDPVHSGLPAGTVVCCGDPVYQRLIVFTRRDPEYVATLTRPDQGERHVVEAFFQNGRMVRLLRDGRAVGIGYADSVMGRAWYSGARALLQEASTAAAQAGPRPEGPAAPPEETGTTSMAARLLRFGLVVFVIALAVLGFWLWKRYRAKAPPKAKPTALSIAMAAFQAQAPQPPPPEDEEEGWVCPYCHADVLPGDDTCWLCERPRPEEPPRPRMMICACGEPAPWGSKVCIRCGKAFKPQPR